MCLYLFSFCSRRSSAAYIPIDVSLCARVKEEGISFVSAQSAF